MKRDFLTIVFMRHAGKVRSFEMRTHVFIFLIIFLPCLVLASLYFTCGYFLMGRENASLRKEIGKVQAEVESLNVKVRESDDHKKWSNTILSSLLNAVEIKPSEQKKSAKSGSGAVQSGKGKSKIGNLLSSEVSISDFKVRTDKSDPNTMNINYTIINNDESHGVISGYTAVIAQNMDITPPIFKVVPEVGIRNGVPMNWRKGELFSIRYLKHMKFPMEKPKGDAVFREVVIFIYSPEGKLLLRNSFDITM